MSLKLFKGIISWHKTLFQSLMTHQPTVRITLYLYKGAKQCIATPRLSLRIREIFGSRIRSHLRLTALIVIWFSSPEPMTMPMESLTRELSTLFSRYHAKVSPQPTSLLSGKNSRIWLTLVLLSFSVASCHPTAVEPKSYLYDKLMIPMPNETLLC